MQKCVFLTDVMEAVIRLRDGCILVYPTETFFAVGCLATDVRAIAAVYDAKRRGADKPLPVVIGQKEQLGLLTAEKSPLLSLLAARFWPGPLSILVPASESMPAILTRESNRIAVRLTSHPVAAALCRACGPLVSTSANLTGREPIMAAEDVDTALLEHVAGVLALPPKPAGGRPSTLVEMVGQHHVRIVRPGAVSRQQLLKAGIQVV